MKRFMLVCGGLLFWIGAFAIHWGLAAMLFGATVVIAAVLGFFDSDDGQASPLERGDWRCSPPAGDDPDGGRRGD